jgi:GNAT superfamily N-acetyltransferase
MTRARAAQEADLPALIDLFQSAEVSQVVAPLTEAARTWLEILSRPGVTVFVSEADGTIAATCMLITIPNLLREGRAHGFIENVVTRPALRRHGHARAVVMTALARAWEENCHHVLLQSGRKDPRVHRFYESCGFEPGLRTSYVAHRP